MSRQKQEHFLLANPLPNQHYLEVAKPTHQEDSKVTEAQLPYSYTNSSILSKDFSQSLSANTLDASSQFSNYENIPRALTFLPYQNNSNSFNPYSSSFLHRQNFLNPFTFPNHLNSMQPITQQQLPHNFSHMHIDQIPTNFTLQSDLTKTTTPDRRVVRNTKRTTQLEKEWTPQDDYYLRECVDRYRNDWKKVFKEFKKKYKYVTIAFLKARYRMIKTTPFELRVRFTHEEDLLIAKLIGSLGKKWDQIATYFVNRTPIMIKNRYYSYIKKRNILKELLAEGQGKDSISESIETLNTDPSSNDSNGTRGSKLLNLEEFEEDPIDQYFCSFAPDEQLNERITPFLENFDFKYDEEPKIRLDSSPLETTPLEFPNLNQREYSMPFDTHQELHSSLFYNGPFSATSRTLFNGISTNDPSTKAENVDNLKNL